MGNGSSSAAQGVANINATDIQDAAGQASRNAIRDFKLFNITITSLALCILTLSCLFYSVFCYRRRRHQKRTKERENAGRERLQKRTNDRAAKTRNLLSLLQRTRAPRDDPRVYFIYSNPVPVGDNNGQSPGAQDAETHTHRERVKDHSDGVILDPSVFYMQL